MFFFQEKKPSNEKWGVVVFGSTRVWLTSLQRSTNFASFSFRFQLETSDALIYPRDGTLTNWWRLASEKS